LVRLLGDGKRARWRRADDVGDGAGVDLRAGREIDLVHEPARPRIAGGDDRHVDAENPSSRLLRLALAAGVRSVSDAGDRRLTNALGVVEDQSGSRGGSVVADRGGALHAEDRHDVGAEVDHRIESRLVLVFRLGSSKRELAWSGERLAIDRPEAADV